MENDRTVEEVWRDACNANEWHALDAEEWLTVIRFARLYVEADAEECEDLCDSD